MSFSLGLTAKEKAGGRFAARTHRVLAQAIRKAKAEKGITQSEIAHALGVNKSVVSRILSGEGNLTLRTIGEIAWAVGLRPELHFNSIKKEKRHGANTFVLGPVGVKQGGENDITRSHSRSSVNTFNISIKESAYDD